MPLLSAGVRTAKLPHADNDHTPDLSSYHDTANLLEPAHDGIPCLDWARPRGGIPSPASLPHPATPREYRRICSKPALFRGTSSLAWHMVLPYSYVVIIGTRDSISFFASHRHQETLQGTRPLVGGVVYLGPPHHMRMRSLCHEGHHPSPLGPSPRFQMITSAVPHPDDYCVFFSPSFTM